MCVPIGLGLLAACGGEPPHETEAGPVVARVGTHPITTRDLLQELASFRGAAGRPQGEARNRVLERAILLELTERVAAERSLLVEPQYREHVLAIDLEARRRKQDVLRRLLAEDLVRGYTPTEQEVLQYYEESGARFRTTRLHLRELVTATEGEADEALAEIRSGSPFEEVARRRSIAASAQEAGRIGPFDRGLVPAHLAGQAYRLEESGQIAGPFKTPPGWTLLLLENREEGVARDLEQVRPAVERILERKEMQQRYEQMIDEARERFGVSIDEAVLSDDSLFETARTR
jgi:parvulin-like peptidyl-prolyl isomerase